MTKVRHNQADQEDQSTRDARGLAKLRRTEYLALGQGAFYLATGVWPLLSMPSFERVTGPKTDQWLVKTAGVLITAIGGALLLAGARRRVSPEIEWLAVASAAGLTAIDVVYVAQGRIAPVYLLDAAAELALVGSWLAVDRNAEQES
jgi:hypothetical protein